MPDVAMTEKAPESAVATPFRTICKHCGGPIEKPRKGKEYCKPKCRFAQWDKDHPRMVRWK